MTWIDTSGWVLHDNLRELTTSALNTFATNNPNFYTLLETEESVYSTLGGEHRRADVAQCPFLIPNVPTFGETSPVTYHSLSHGKSVRPYQTMQWTGPQGQHIHCMPTIDSIKFYQNVNAPIGFNMRFYYSSLTNNYAFPNFNDASIEMDVILWWGLAEGHGIRILNWPISTTGAGSNVVFSTTAPSGSVLRRSGVGTGEMEVHGVEHIASNSQIETFGDINTNFVDSGGFLYNFAADANWYMAVRFHSPTAPFQLDYNVSRVTNLDSILSQVGPYGGAETHEESPSGNLRLGGTVVVTHTEQTGTAHEVNVVGGIGLSGQATQSFEEAGDEIMSSPSGNIGLGGSVVVDHVDLSGSRN